MTKSTDKHNDHILEDCLHRLQDKNIRITNQRKAILSYMINSKTHPTVDDIYQDLLMQFQGLSLATVYNNLKLLVEEGIIKEMKFSDVTSRYDIMLEPHYHILCTECGKITDFHHDLNSQLELDAVEQTGYKFSKTNIELFGVCPDCQKKIQSAK